MAASRPQRRKSDQGIARVVKAAGPVGVLTLFAVLGAITYFVIDQRAQSDNIKALIAKVERAEKRADRRESIAAVNRQTSADIQREDLRMQVAKLTSHLDCVLAISPERRSPTTIQQCLGSDSDPTVLQKVEQYYTPAPAPAPAPTVVVTQQPERVVERPIPGPTVTVTASPNACTVEVGKVIKGLCR